MIKGLKITGPEQVWVSDITYVKTDEGACYLNLFTDAFSRKIMGFSIANNISAEAMKTAYQMAISQRSYTHPLIHRSGRGFQYCNEKYVKLSTGEMIIISMTENGNLYENALAERMNCTLKEEFGLGSLLPLKAAGFRLAQRKL